MKQKKKKTKILHLMITLRAFVSPYVELHLSFSLAPTMMSFTSIALELGFAAQVTLQPHCLYDCYSLQPHTQRACGGGLTPTRTLKCKSLLLLLLSFFSFSLFFNRAGSVRYAVGRLAHKLLTRFSTYVIEFRSSGRPQTALSLYHYITPSLSMLTLLARLLPSVCWI